MGHPDEPQRPPPWHGLALRWRIAALSSAAIALLSVVAAGTAFWVVRDGLIGDLQRSLREDVRAVADLYAAGGPGAAGASLAGPTGGVIVQLYDAQGGLLAASSSRYERAEAVIPAEVLQIEAGVRDWSGELGGNQVLAAISAFEFGSAAVIAETDYIAGALAGLGRALLVTALVLILLSALVGYLIAASAIAPVRNLARQAAELGPQRLEPIRYRGPPDEVGQLAATLNDLIARLKESIDSQRQFLAETSHELRTPLTGLQGYLDRASRKAGPEVARELAEARRISQAMARLVGDLLQLSRGELVKEMTPHLVDAHVDVMAPIAQEFPGVELEVDGDGDKMVLGDPERLKQLVRNLAANAVRAAGGPGGVVLAVRGGGSAESPVELIVRDEGPGIPPEAQERIFEKFYKGPGGGSGLGLAIARQLAELHGGSIRVDSRPGRTEFRVSLPAADVPD